MKSQGNPKPKSRAVRSAAGQKAHELQWKPANARVELHGIAEIDLGELTTSVPYKVAPVALIMRGTTVSNDGWQIG